MKKHSLLLVLLLTSLLVGGLQLYQLLAITEPGTGFLTVSHWSVPALWILLPLSIAALMVMGALAAPHTLPLEGDAGQRANGFCFLLPAFCLFWDALQGLLFSQDTQGDPMFRVWWSVLDLLEILTAVGCLALAATMIQKKAPRRPLMLPGLLLSAYLAFRALLTYLSASAVITVPSTLFHILALLGLSLFYLAAARLFSSVGEAQGRRKLLVYGGPGLLLAFSYLFPAVIGGIFAGTQVSPVSFETVTIASLFLCALPLFEQTLLSQK